MTFSENKEINDVINQGLFRGNESALLFFFNIKKYHMMLLILECKKLIHEEFKILDDVDCLICYEQLQERQ